MESTRSLLLKLGALLIGGGVLWCALFAGGANQLGAAQPLAVALGCIFAIAGFASLLTGASRSQGTAGALRLDWFVPFLKKRKRGAPEPSLPLVLRCARAVAPRSLFADLDAGKPGLLRKSLKRIGPTMLSSPVRRMVQAACLLLFFWLFFYVCWPYTAQPQAVGESSTGWKFADLDQETGEVRLTRAGPDVWTPQPGQTLFVLDEQAATAGATNASPFVISSVGEGEIALAPPSADAAGHIDQFLTGSGGWTLYEHQPGAWPSHYADDLAAKESIAAEFFLMIDPLVSLSTAIAARSWVWSLVFAGVILVVCVLVPRGFCGYLCPLGTLIDLFDWAIGKRVTRFRVADDGWWVHVKYYLLAGVLVCSVFGVLVSGYVAAIPVITRGMLFLGEPLQIGMLREWRQAPPLNAGHALSIALFFAVLGLGLLKPRFWCKYVCPSGAVFSLGNLFRATERKVESTCINCNKCVEICPFDAIKPDFTTRVTDCTLCQTCGGVCPTHAIKFVERWNVVELKIENDPPTGETPIGRRGFLSLAAGSAGAAAGGAALAAATRAFGARLDDPAAVRPVRPPGSVPEREFLQMCIRCGECFKACPNNVLHPLAFQQGLEGLWTPHMNADWAGCESSCNACGQVCPTGAIRALPLEEKKAARMGLAIVDEQTCLPFAGREACDLCVVECDKAGYKAIEFTRVGTEVDGDGRPIEGSGLLAPVVLPEKCVGCGVCQTRCYKINVKEKKLLRESAIIVEAGEGKEDRLTGGSYVALREQEAAQRASRSGAGGKASSGYFVPGADSSDPFATGGEAQSPVPSAPAESDDDPFGLN